jgi:hypothetical protein
MVAFSYTLHTSADGNWSPPRNRLSRSHESAANKRSGYRGALSYRPACVCLLFTTILFLWNPIAAQEPGYVQRQVVTTNGAITFIGNSLGLNKQPGEVEGPGTSGSIGTFITTDTSSFDNNWPDGTTANFRLNNSSAVLSLPSGSRVIHAELIWGGVPRRRLRHRYGSPGIPGGARHLHHTGWNNICNARSNDRCHAIRSSAKLLRPHGERHGPRQRRGKRYVHGWSRSRDYGGRRQLQRRRLDAGDSLRGV